MLHSYVVRVHYSTGIAAGVGSAAAVLLVAITCMILVIGVAVYESRKPKVYTISV